MERKLHRGIFWVVLLVILMGGTLACHRQKENMGVIKKLAQMKDPKYRGQELSPQTVEELRKIVASYEKQVKSEVADTEQLGTLYKNMAVKYLEIEQIKTQINELSDKQNPATDQDYLFVKIIAATDRKLYNMAYESLKKALEYQTENELLYFYAAVSCGYLGKSFVESEEAATKFLWLDRAESYYKRALEINKDYADALFGYAVLLFYEFNRKEQAKSYLERLLNINSQNVDAMFMLAYIYNQEKNYSAALDLYTKIEKLTVIEEKKNLAIEQKNSVLGKMNEALKSKK